MQARKLLIVLAAAVPVLAATATPTGRDLAQSTRAKPDLAHGAELFVQCVSCHGPNGAGVESGETPRIAGQHYSVLLKQLVDFRHGQRWDFRMEERAKNHYLVTPQDIADVAAFVAQLDGGNAPGTGDGIHAADGARIFGARCASCHGPSGAGDAARAIPLLSGQHYGYLMRQMYDAVDGRRPTLQLVHPRKIEPLYFQQVRAVAEYLSRIEWDVPRPAPAQPH
jgi:cytochrome c553